jgi:hypothetical protein
VKFIVPFPGGGINDVLARIIGEKLQAKWGQPIVVENKTGAGGNIGADLAYQSEPDGYTLLLSPPGPLAINQTLYKHLSYKPQDFVPITVVGSVPNVVIVRKELPVTSLKELIDYVRVNPGKVTFGSQGNGATPHLTAMMFQGMTDTQMVHVPYRGETLVLNDMIGGHVDVFFGNIAAGSPPFRDGRVKILAIADYPPLAGAARDSHHGRGRLAGSRVHRLVRARGTAEDSAGIDRRDRQSRRRRDQGAGRAGQVPHRERRADRQQPGRDGGLHPGRSAALGRGHQEEQYRRGLRHCEAHSGIRAAVKNLRQCDGRTNGAGQRHFGVMMAS